MNCIYNVISHHWYPVDVNKYKYFIASYTARIYRYLNCNDAENTSYNLIRITPTQKHTYDQQYVIGHVTLVAITETAVQVPYLEMKSLQSTWKSLNAWQSASIIALSSPITWARFQKRSARDRLRYDPVILIGRSHSANADHDRLIRSRKYETKQFIANWIMT